MNTSIRISLMCVLAAATLALIAPASAEEMGPSITVHFADLNISDPAGAEILYRRIQVAALRVCSYDADAALPGLGRSCYLKTLADAVSKINSPKLNAVRIRKHGNASKG